MAQQNNIWPPNLITFPGMNHNDVELIHEDINSAFHDPNFAPVFHQKIKEALDGRRHAAGLQPYDNNHFQAALNTFLIDEALFPNLRIPFPQNQGSAEGNAGAASAVGGRRKRATRKRATHKQRKTKKHLKRKARKVRKTRK